MCAWPRSLGAAAPRLTRSEIVDLLSSRGSDQAWLFAQARAARCRVFGQRAAVRGVIEVASVCVQNCTYCPMRRDNRIARYIYDHSDIVALSRRIHNSNIRIVSLQGGDTPRTTKIVGQAIIQIREIFEDDVDILLVLGDK